MPRITGKIGIFKKKTKLKIGQIWGRGDNDNPFIISPAYLILDIKDGYILFKPKFMVKLNEPVGVLKKDTCSESEFRWRYPILIKDTEE